MWVPQSERVEMQVRYVFGDIRGDPRLLCRKRIRFQVKQELGSARAFFQKSEFSNLTLAGGEQWQRNLPLGIKKMSLR